MKEWNTPALENLEINQTAKKGNGNNDTNIHKGWCEMHKHPENGVCTCGAISDEPQTDKLS